LLVALTIRHLAGGGGQAHLPGDLHAARPAESLMFEDGIAVTPLVIVAVVVAHVLTARLTLSFAPGDAGPAMPAARSTAGGADMAARGDRDETGERRR
jgi:hypothetical protein